jgi:DnaJ-class molecular chaperone
MKQVNASRSAYHVHMKRDLPVTYCTKCGGVGHNIRVVGGRCCKNRGEQRCDGVNAVATNKLDWEECPLCQATGYYRNKECPDCKGAGYLFVGLRDTAAV